VDHRSTSPIIDGVAYFFLNYACVRDVISVKTSVLIKALSMGVMHLGYVTRYLLRQWYLHATSIAMHARRC